MFLKEKKWKIFLSIIHTTWFIRIQNHRSSPDSSPHTRQPLHPAFGSSGFSGRGLIPTRVVLHSSHCSTPPVWCHRHGLSALRPCSTVLNAQTSVSSPRLWSCTGARRCRMVQPSLLGHLRLCSPLALCRAPCLLVALPQVQEVSLPHRCYHSWPVAVSIYTTTLPSSSVLYHRSSSSQLRESSTPLGLDGLSASRCGGLVKSVVRLSVTITKTLTYHHRR